VPTAAESKDRYRWVRPAPDEVAPAPFTRYVVIRRPDGSCGWSVTEYREWRAGDAVRAVTLHEEALIESVELGKAIPSQVKNLARMVRRPWSPVDEW
jgi:hypothetical protein